MTTPILIFATAALAAAPIATEHTSSFVLPSGVSVRIVERPFTQGKLKVSGCNESSATCLINGRTPMGIVSTVPKTYVWNISVTYRGKSYQLKADDMYDAWGERPLEHKGVVRHFGGACVDLENCQFRGLFSDGAASFVAEWKIVNGVESRTILTDSRDVMEVFRQSIDPPVD